jgi:hypothetical protein
MTTILAVLALVLVYGVSSVSMAVHVPVAETLMTLAFIVWRTMIVLRMIIWVPSIIRPIIITVLMIKLPGVIVLIDVTGTFLGVCIFLGLLLPLMTPIVFAAANVGIMPALKEFLDLKNVIFGNAMLLCIFDSISLSLDKFA